LSRITACLQALKAQGKKALIPYIVAGDPGPEFTVPLMHQLVAQGADILELGVPFSDPMAEGPVIQLAHERALKHNVSLTSVLAMVKEFRLKDQVTPIVLMGYANPVVRMGVEQLAASAAAVGLDGLLTVDMPPEEAVELNLALKAVNVDSIFLIAPTTTEARIQSIVDLATGYLYYVSLKGVTGAANLDIVSVKEKLAQIKAKTDLPVTVGFGIKDAATAAAVAKVADGVVVGSALVQALATLVESKGLGAIEPASQLIGDMRKAMDSL